VVLLVVLATVAGTSGTAGAQAGDSEDALLVTSARRAVTRGRYRRAARLLDRALRVNPRRMEAYVLRASVYAVSKQPDRAVALMRRARELAPESPDVLAALGSHLVLAGKSREGVRILERVVRLWPRRFQAHLSLGHHFVSVHDWKRAIAAFQAYFRSRPQQLARADAIHRVALANALLRSGQASRAEREFRRVLGLDRGNVTARLGVAWAAAARNCRRAMPLLAGLSDVTGRYPRVWLVQGRCALRLGRTSSALTIAKRYRAARSGDPAGYELLSRAHEGNGDRPAALAAMRRAVARAPKQVGYGIRLARLERLTGNAAGAVKRLRDMGVPKDDRAAAWTLELGEALVAARRYPAARALLEPWVRSHPASPHGRLLLGAALLEGGDASAAVGHLTRAMFGRYAARARPLIHRAYLFVARRAIRANDLAEAETRLRAALAVDEDGRARRLLGAVLLLRGRPADALPVLRAAVARRSSDAVARLLLARAHRLGGELAAARRVLRSALAEPRQTHRVALAIELAATELADKKYPAAITVLERTLARRGANAPSNLRQAHYRAVRAAATAWLTSGAYRRATMALRALDKRVGKADKRRDSIDCDIALAATGARLPGVAIPRLNRLVRAKARCPFAAPADTQAPAILLAWNRGMVPGQARRALWRLARLRRRTTKVSAQLARMAARDLAVRAAAEAYKRNDLRRARIFLRNALAVDRRSPEVQHNQAVLMLARNQHRRAIPILERVSSRVPEALVNLGIAYDARGEPRKAVAYYRRAYRAGVRMGGRLKHWIAIKERLWGVR
jgi:tetratricopeptide (TPR) repeat protein